MLHRTFLLSADSDNEKVKPFLKWVGGKTQLLAEITQCYPFSSGAITKYAEPFVGGGAVLFDILNKFKLSELYISDINAELINAYCTIRDNVDELVAMLSVMQDEFVPKDSELRKSYYLAKRERFNDLKINDSQGRNCIEKAALMIFLNRTCFNGLYRVNRNKLFNVPIGRHNKVQICNDRLLYAISRRLQNVTIVLGDYKQAADFIDSHTFVYLDPPYRPITSTASFTAYTEYAFTDREQLELAQFVCDMHQKGAKIVISNSDPKNTDPNDDFFEKIYAPYDIKHVSVSRMINCDSSKRNNNLKELLIKNF